MRTLSLIALLFPFTVAADVTVTISNVTTATEFDLAITGDPVDASLQLHYGGLWDWCKVGGTTGSPIATTPALGNDNDGIQVDTITVRGPVQARCDVDLNTNFAAANVTVAGVQKQMTLSGGVWRATITTTLPPPPVGSATLSWNAPTRNTDGSPLTNLAGYKLYWGNAVGTYPNTRQVNTSPEIVDLAAGTWFFAVTALTSAGTESVFSNVASKTIAGTPVPVDCVVSNPPWVLGALTPAVCPANGMQTRAESRVLAIIIQPANGGMACPPLNETRDVPVTCTPPGPPPSVCVSDPLTVTVSTWPAGRTGSRTLTFSTGNKSRLRYTHDWPLTGAQTLSVTDTRGCTVTVTR